MFIESKIGLNDAEICLKGRSLLDINGVILSYFEQLVPDEVDEVTFWRRYFYWKYQWHLREILISKHSSDHKQDIDDDEDDDENENADEVRLGDCENAKETEREQTLSNRNTSKINKNEADMEKEEVLGGNMPMNEAQELQSNGNSGSGSRFSETSWTDAANHGHSSNEHNSLQVTNHGTRTDTVEEEILNENENDDEDIEQQNDDDNQIGLDQADQQAKSEKKENQNEDKETEKGDDAEKGNDYDKEEEEEEDGSWADWD